MAQDVPTATGAQLVLQALDNAGVRVVFANPGTTEMFFVSALDSVPTLRPVLCLHENVCSGAADGYARIAGKPAATLLHLGPGFSNAMANLHNAKRASTPLINVVGEMSSSMKHLDPPLNMNLLSASALVSGATIEVTKPADLCALPEAIESCMRGSSSNTRGSRVCTISVTHDFSWQEIEQSHLPRPIDNSGTHGRHSPENASALRAFIKDCAAALQSCLPGKAAVFVGGQALREQGGALTAAGRIAAATKADLVCETHFPAIDRGAGLPHPKRLTYFPQEAEVELSKYELLLVVDAALPVAMFGYRDGPSSLVHLGDDKVWQLDAGSCDVALALALLEEEVGGSAVKPGVNCGGVFPAAARPGLPSGRLTPASLCATLAALQPEGAITVDEALTTGLPYWEAAKGCPPFTHLTLTGGAIGCGIPLALGASLAAPQRPVINLQADGSAMYSLQALWSIAREGCHVITIICANNAYNILKLEAARQRLPPLHAAASPPTAPHGFGGAASLLELKGPVLDWVALAAGMGVSGVKVDSCEQLAAALQAALEQRGGPHLIQANLA